MQQNFPPDEKARAKSDILPSEKLAKNRNIILSVIVVGTLMGAVDSTIVLLAFPTITAKLHTNFEYKLKVRNPQIVAEIKSLRRNQKLKENRDLLYAFEQPAHIWSFTFFWHPLAKGMRYER